MIYEIALLPVRPESVDTFKRAFDRIFMMGIEEYLSEAPSVAHVEGAVF